MCDIHHHLQCYVWKAGLVVVVLRVMCLRSHVQASGSINTFTVLDCG